MEPEPHKLLQDQPEGDRDLIDRELARQDAREGQGTVKEELSGAQKKPGQPPDSDERAADELRSGAEQDTGKNAGSPGDASSRTENSRAMDEAAPQTGVRPGP
jgi:hypothetical protein